MGYDHAMRSALQSVDLGPEIVQLLLPQRRPMLMVDRVLGLDLGSARPSLLAVRHVSANEPLLAGHFPNVGMVPGVITVEGLAQASGLLGRLVDLQRTWIGELLDDLAHLELGATLQPGFDAARGRQATARLRSEGRLHVVGQTSVKLLAPIFPGCRLDHRVELTRRLGTGWWFTVSTEVAGKLVAQGTLAASTLEGGWPP